MRRLGARLRGADPMRSVGAQPDARGEADLRTLAGDAPPARVAATSPRSPAIRAAVVLAVVLVAVTGVSTAVLVGAHPTRQAAVGTATTARTASPSPAARATIDGCDPSAILPFECGTYRSIFGVKSVTGDRGGPAKDALTIWFSAASGEGALVLHAVGAGCFEATIPVKVVTTQANRSRLERAGPAQYGQRGCSGPGPDTAGWAYPWLNGPLEVDSAGLGGLAFNLKSLVTFEYEGTTPYGTPPLPRNDRSCVAAHVRPFSCGTYRSVAGSGSLAFLGSAPYRLTFEHINGELTASFFGRCNGISVVFEVVDRTVIALPGATSSMLCTGPPGAEDDEVSDFFSGTLAVQIDGSHVVFTRGGGSAEFEVR